MKKSLAVVLMVMLLPCTGYALQVTFYDKGAGTDVTWTGFDAKTNFAGVIETSIGGVFCVELGQSVGPGVYEYMPITPTGNLIKAAWLMNQFGTSVLTNTEAAGLQAAIWEAIYGENFNLESPADVQTAQAGYLAALPQQPTLPAGYFILANRDAQDVITRVPEPITMLLLGVGLVGLAGLRRKQ